MTVSNVVNDHPNVRRATREKVLEAMARLEDLLPRQSGSPQPAQGPDRHHRSRHSGGQQCVLRRVGCRHRRRGRAVRPAGEHRADRCAARERTGCAVPLTQPAVRRTPPQPRGHGLGRCRVAQRRLPGGHPW
ncbi:LacI family DNA-binding transcriptional regulator [Streptomyces sp. V4I2]|uniref:LacI family DNA-binding transcriptional regulator n=1 Tax=Streptomyces TaxID=1883 RepID=UPI003593BECC